MNTQESISKQKLTIDSTPEIVDAIADLEQFAGVYEIPVVLIQKINIALQELLSSIINNISFKKQKTSIELLFSLSQTGKLSIELRYGGTAFNPFFPTNQVIKKQPILEDIGSLGQHLVRKCMDSYYYQLENQQNVVFMCKDRV